MIIGISGGSGSGKSTFIQELRNRFDFSDLGLISEDNYYKEWHLQSKDSRGVINFDIPDAIDHEALLKDLDLLKNNQIVARKEYSFNNVQKEPQDIIVKPAKIYIIEGLFIFHNKALSNLLNLKVLIHAKDELKIIRRIKRDQNERNYPIDDVLYRYQYHVGPAYDLYIRPYLEDMDIVINNNTHFNAAIELFEAWIRSKLG
ncbi:MAG: uridine kinase [Saprospiraceae bacterium]|nr:uridine kinase [Saprospiraceae bacterium]